MDQEEHPLLTEVEAAERLNLKPRTLQAWRLRGGGPPYAKLGSSVRYEVGRLNRWVEQRLRQSTADDTSRAGPRRMVAASRRLEEGVLR